MGVETRARPVAARFAAHSPSARHRDVSRWLLSEVLRLAGPRGELSRHSQRPWSSITFSGSRHTVTLAFEGAEAIACGEALLAALPDHEFTIPRTIVADATVVAVEHTNLPAPRMTVEAEFLLLEDA